MKTAIILAAGQGSKIWPYESMRPKCLLPVANVPLIVHQVSALVGIGVKRIIVAANRQVETVAALFRNNPLVEVVDVGETRGTAHSLMAVLPKKSDSPCWVIYGDCWIGPKDLAKLEKLGEFGALVTPHVESSKNHIGCTVKDGLVSEIIGHSREKTTHHFLGFAFHPKYEPYLKATPAYFPRVDVGMMVPEEYFLEAALINLIKDGVRIPVLQAEAFAMDIDKPWHLLETNVTVAKETCAQIEEHILLEGSSMDPSASLQGNVRLGKNSRIGKNVIVEGNLWVGDDTVIDNGAFLKGETVIGNQCEIGYGCFIDKGSVIGDRCKVLHGAELSGVLFPNVYLYHYMEIAGMMGENTDIGAGTVCGSLRFDDANTTQRIKGRRESLSQPAWANACYIGDQCRTGVNAILLPGTKMGSGSLLGPGVMLTEDLEAGKLLLLKQELIKKDWNPDKYGW